jgi:type II secretory pathway pseudopilin PulG
MRRKESGFTMVEILTVVGIIAMLVAVLIPTLTMVRRIAKETKQTAQLTAIELALTAFRSGSGYNDYPPSSWQGNPLRTDYSGAQMLAEALVGWDLMGFHPDSAWRSNGEDEDGKLVYDLTGTEERKEENLRERRGPYVELGTANAFRLGNISVDKPGLFNDTGAFLAPDTFVICDTFGVRKVQIATGRTVRAGTPILYYRANTSRRNIDDPQYDQRIYNVYDNYSLVDLRSLTPDGRPGIDHPLGYSLDALYYFDYNGGIRDPKVTATPWPHRPDSYILISAGADGLYGTEDDIRNF